MVDEKDGRDMEVTSSENLLEVEALRVAFAGFGKTANVVESFSLSVGHRQKVGVVGETGCGKSVSMKAILGVLPERTARLSAKRLVFNDREIRIVEGTRFKGLKGGGVSYVPQDPMSSLNPVYTVGSQLYDIVRTGIDRERATREKVKREILEALEAVRLSNPEVLLRQYPWQLSGGMQQRILIAMAITREPQLLVGDEPGTALDVTIQDQILRLLNDLVKDHGVSIVIITHNLGVIRLLSDRVTIMYAGCVVEEGVTTQVFEDPKHPYTQGLLDSIPKLTGLGIAKGIRGRIPDYRDPPPGCRFHPRCDYCMTVCTDTRPEHVDISAAHSVACYLYSDGVAHEC